MKVKEIMERAGINQTGRAVAYIKDALDEMNIISETHVTTQRMDINANQRFYNVPNDCNLLKPLIVSIKRSGSENYFAIPSGISSAEHNFESITTQTPSRWDVLEDGGVPKLELWPTPDTSDDSIRLEYNSGLKPFSEDIDLTSIEPQLILLHGITHESTL